MNINTVRWARASRLPIATRMHTLAAGYYSYELALQFEESDLKRIALQNLSIAKCQSVACTNSLLKDRSTAQPLDHRKRGWGQGGLATRSWRKGGVAEAAAGYFCLEAKRRKGRSQHLKMQWSSLFLLISVLSHSGECQLQAKLILSCCFHYLASQLAVASNCVHLYQQPGSVLLFLSIVHEMIGATSGYLQRTLLQGYLQHF